MSLSSQVRNLFRYRLLIRTLLGPRRAERLVNRATFVISTGTNDMLSAYLASNRSSAISTAAYENYLIARVANFTQVISSPHSSCNYTINLSMTTINQVMSMLGGRRFIFVGLPPMGCLPIVRTLVGTGSQRCDARLNQLAMSFNSKLLQLLNIINSQNQIRTSYIDAYTIINDATTDPNKFGKLCTFFLHLTHCIAILLLLVRVVRPVRGLKRMLWIRGDRDQPNMPRTNNMPRPYQVPLLGCYPSHRENQPTRRRCHDGLH